MKRGGAHDDQPHYTIIFRPTIWRFTEGAINKCVIGENLAPGFRWKPSKNGGYGWT